MHGIYAIAPVVPMEMPGHAVAERVMPIAVDGGDNVPFAAKGNNGGDGSGHCPPYLSFAGARAQGSCPWK